MFGDTQEQCVEPIEGPSKDAIAGRHGTGQGMEVHQREMNTRSYEGRSAN